MDITDKLFKHLTLKNRLNIRYELIRKKFYLETNDPENEEIKNISFLLQRI